MKVGRGEVGVWFEFGVEDFTMSKCSRGFFFYGICRLVGKIDVN